MIVVQIVDRTSSRLVSRKALKGDFCEEDSDLTSQEFRGQRVWLDNLLYYASRFAGSDIFLLLGENDDEKMRLLIAPREGSALEIKILPLTFNEAKKRLELEWEKLRALEKKEKKGTGQESAAVEENGKEVKQEGK